MKKTTGNILKLVLALGLGLFIAWLSLKGLTAQEKHNIYNSFKAADYRWVLLSIFIGVLSHLTRAIRWRILLKPMGYEPRTLNAFWAVMIGYFSNLGLPRSGELIRCTILYKEERIPVDKSFGTVIIERAIDMVVFFSLFFITLAVEYTRIDSYLQRHIYPRLHAKYNFLPDSFIGGYILLIPGLSILLVVLIFRKNIGRWKPVQNLLKVIKGVWEGLKSIGKIQKPGWFVFLSLLIWVFYYLMVYLTLFALPQTAHLSMLSGLSILVLGSIGIMVTPGGIGLYPVIVSQTLVLYGIEASSGIGLAMGWLTWSAQTLMILILGIISLIVVSQKTTKHGLSQEDLR